MVPSKEELEKHGVKSPEQRKKQGRERSDDEEDVGDVLTGEADDNNDYRNSKDPKKAASRRSKSH